MTPLRRAAPIALLLLVGSLRAAAAETPDPVPEVIEEHARHWSRVMPRSVPASVRDQPLRALDLYRARVAELGPGSHTILSERDTVLTTFGGGKQIQLLVSDPNWGSSPTVVMSVHERVPGGMGEIERHDFHPWSFRQAKPDGSQEWVLEGANVSDGAWENGAWNGTQSSWFPLEKSRWLVTESRVTGPASWRSRAVGTKRFLATRRGLTPVSRDVADRLSDTARGGYSFKQAPYFVSWSDLRKAGVHPVIDSRGRHSIRRSPKMSRDALRALDVTYVKRSVDGKRAHLRGRR